MATWHLDERAGNLRVRCYAAVESDEPYFNYIKKNVPQFAAGDLIVTNAEDGTNAGPFVWIEGTNRGDLARLIAPPVCPDCGGKGQVRSYCDDPQCGDSTWDHNCTDGYVRCPKGCKAPAKKV